MNRCLNCGEHPGVTKNDGTLKNFCGKACETAWEKVHIERGDSIGFGGHDLLPVYEIIDRSALFIMALVGDRESIRDARRELRRRYRLKAIYDPNKKQEVRL